MAGQGPNTGAAPGQAQMMRETDQAQNPNFLQETGTHVKGMAQGAVDVGKGAALGTASIVRGAAQGVANITQGTTDAVKNTFGMNNDNSAPTSTNYADNSGGPAKPSYPHTPNL